MNTIFTVAALELKAIYALAAGISIAVVGVAAAIGMAMVIGKALDGIARQPEADGKIRSSLILGLIFIETVIIYVLLISVLLVINVL
ncbi:MAG: ATP synthase subunit c [Firmicutes bacterium ADurb.Bin080]|jgi:F-type H+-transporting ATPase subunit c|nr:ATP synthase F0 subunit C [Clostridiales bacterium]OQC11845.1 MAG: ATP synthase subunit c [Firmicutes bacterium ADurb.Bin080]